MKIRVSFSENLPRIKQILMDIAAQNPLCLVSPLPSMQFLEFGETGVLLQFAVWGKQSTFDDMATNLQMEIQSALVEANIQLPTPQYTFVSTTTS